jgi:hypothetical protein
MLSQPAPAPLRFAHRPVKDGVVSFCLRCFQNVAEVKDESDLGPIEMKHVCPGPPSSWGLTEDK